jgi:hypothetical protein
MKLKTISLILLLGLLLSACTSQTPTSTQIPEGVYTVVAQTLTALYTPVTATATPLPATETPTPTPTLDITPSLSTGLTPTSPASAATTSGQQCYDAVFANDVTVPDGTIMSPGQIFTKTWAIKNTGSCDWDEIFALKFYSGDKMDGHRTVVSNVVKAGKTTSFSITMSAPTTPGTYIGYWRMVNNANINFGERVSVKIIVQ